MQIVNAILKISGGRADVCTSAGRPLPSVNLPEVKIGIDACLDLDLRCDQLLAGTLLPYHYDELSEADSFYIAMDGDWDHKTQPKLYSSSGITLIRNDEGFIHFRAPLPNTNTEMIRELVSRKKAIVLHIEFCGYKTVTGSARAIFAWDFDILLRNRIFLDGDVPDEVAANPIYLTAAEIRALIAEATRSETPGPSGRPGNDGNDGEDGLSAYELAVANGYTGSVTAWLNDLKGKDGKDGADGAKGEDGKGLHYDASGTITEKVLYDERPAGFKFAAAIVDSVNKKTELYIFTKRSALAGDWYETPVKIVFYSFGNSAARVAPVEFNAPTSPNYNYFAVNMAAYPLACAVAVAIDTADGEMLLPYYSDLGVRKIIRKSGTVYVYFGNNVPAYTKGRVYFSQMISTDARLPDLEPEEPETPPKMYYGIVTTAGLLSVKSITSTAGLTEVDAAVMGKTSLGVVPAGSFIAVLIPAASNLAATKFDGIAGKAAFSENNGAAGTGANGAPVTIGNVAYKVYGEFKLNNAEVFIYVD